MSKESGENPMPYTTAAHLFDLTASSVRTWSTSSLVIMMDRDVATEAILAAYRTVIEQDMMRSAEAAITARVANLIRVCGDELDRRVPVPSEDSK